MTSDVVSKLADNVARVRQRISESAAKAGREANEIQLVAVSKYVDSTVTAALLKAGCSHLGESRPQQLWEKAEAPDLRTAKWHMVGHLQRNKVAKTLPLVDLIHSVDSQRLLSAINSTASNADRVARVLLEVNISRDDAKHGFTEDGLQSVVSQLTGFPNVEVCGLMTMAARDGGASVAAQNFAALRELRDAAQPACPENTRLKELSMGMSHDFEEAVREGATIVRVGSALFDGVV